MDAGDTYKASSSLRSKGKRGESFRANSLSLWRNTGTGVFSRSQAQEDDEEALKWAALEKLPTFDRLRKGLLFGSTGTNEINVQDLELQDKRNLVDRLVNTVEEDNAKFLQKLRNRMDRVAIDIPTIEVRFEHLHVDAEAYNTSRAVPNFMNFHINIVEGILNSLHILPSRKKPFTILKDVNGIIKPCRMTLLLGPPSSGKSTLLLALAGKLDTSLKSSGRVTYNGHGMNEFVPQKTAAYISQHDLHIGEMTVRETLTFSARCQGVGSRYEMLAELLRREKAANIHPDPDVDIYMKAAATKEDEANVVTDYILKVLGLDNCAENLVGDEMIRGISGGQKRRVTTGEMMVGPAKALFMDEISNGLDSSTTYQIVNMLRQHVHIMKGTALISLLQPAPETYNLFDDIILLSDSQIVYQGPRENVLGFFESMGFKCPERKGTADFLQEVTSKKDQEQYWTPRNEPYRFISVSEFVDAFQSFVVGQKLRDELATPFDKTRNHPASLTTQKYGLGKLFINLNFICDLGVNSLLVMTLFLRTNMDKDTIEDGGVYAGALFYTITVIMFNGYSELSMTIYKLPIFYKQRDMFFFPPWAYAIPTWILKIPVTFLEVGIYTFSTYYVIGLDPNVGRFMKQYLLLLLLHQTASALFRFIGASGRSMIVANTVGMFALILVFSLGGFVLARVDIKKWCIWGYWSSPMMYAQNAIIVNEFTGHSWSRLVNGTELGVLVLESRGFFPQPYWYWIGVGALFGFIWIYNSFYVISLTYLQPFKNLQAVLVKETETNTLTNSHASHISAQGNESTRRKGMTLLFEPHSLTFDDIRYSVDMPMEMKAQGATEDKLELLKGVSGAFRPGVLTALMGVSGAGKTTLMDVLSGRKTGGYIEGNITISGYPKNQETFARVSGYCEQNDIHSPNVTVYESLLYSAWLRLPQDVDADSIKLFIDEVMELVELNSLKGALVGLPGVSGLSTEQRKRLTIAVELVANPSIIFMDEPTSGLDARAAAIVMRTVRNTVDTGRTVVCTIHQPSIDIFEAFDELFLMKRGGQEIYVGPLGHHSSHLIKYFERIEGVPTIKDGYNPATWMLEVTTSTRELLSGVDFANHYRSSELYMRNKAMITELNVPRPGTKDLFFPTKYSQSFLTQCIACLWKQHCSYWHNPSYTAIRFMFTTFIALVFGTMFWDLGSKWNTEQDLLNAMGSIYTAILFLGLQYCQTVQSVVAIERTVFYREKAARMYAALPYAFSQILIEIPYVLVQSVVFSLILYSMMGFSWDAKKFFWFVYFLFFSLLYFVLLGMMTVSITPNQNVGAIISTFFVTLWNLFSGFVVTRPRMPVWWRWNYWASPVAHSLYGFIVSQFGDVQDEMEGGETVEEFLRDFFGFRRDMLGVVAGVVIGFVVLFTVVFACAIRAFNFQKR